MLSFRCVWVCWIGSFDLTANLALKMLLAGNDFVSNFFFCKLFSCSWGQDTSFKPFYQVLMTLWNLLFKPFKTYYLFTNLFSNLFTNFYTNLFTTGSTNCFMNLVHGNIKAFSEVSLLSKPYWVIELLTTTKQRGIQLHDFVFISFSAQRILLKKWQFASIERKNSILYKLF
jgi:hypothetical protein